MNRTLEEFTGEMAAFMPRYIRAISTRVAKVSVVGDISISQIIILNILKINGRCKMNEIAKGLHVTTSAATGLVDRMVRNSFLKRVPSEKDRRIINIEMTQKGQKIVDDIQKRRYKFIIDIFGKFKPVERERFLNSMKKIYRLVGDDRK